MSAQCSHHSCTISAFRGLRNGFYLGCQIRLTHSIATALLYKKGTLKEKITQILESTFEHAKNLALFVFFYKSLLCLLSFFTKKTAKHHALLAGAISGYIIMRKKSHLKRQIVLYCMGRLLFAAVEKIAKKKKVKNSFIRNNYFTILAAITCGSIMYLFEDDEKNLTPGLNEMLKGLEKEEKDWRGLLPIIFEREDE